jgi:L-lactate dehydrogenase complex protein LldE
VSTKRRRVALFVTCIVDQMYPSIGMASAQLLESQGVEVFVPKGLTCCGQMGFNAGFRDEARTVATHTLEVLPRDTDIVLPSGSCGAMMRHLYEELFDGTSKKHDAEQVVQRTYEISEYLVDVLGVSKLGARFDGKITYHDACHGLRFMGLGDQARHLLENVEGAEVVELPGCDQCCGFGGLFAVKQATLSETMLDRKLDHIVSTDADLLVTGDASCMTQIAGGLSRRGARTRARHIAEVLANMVEAR